MNQCVQDVRAFHEKFKQDSPISPKIPSDKHKILRIALLCEEFDEACQAIKDDDPVGLAKELCDLVYVTVGCAVTYGIDLGPVWDAVHQSNMAKVGGKTTAAGKVLKPKDWQAPDIHSILHDQGWSG